MKTLQPLFSKGLLLLCALLINFSPKLFAQTTVTISPGTGWKDALVRSERPDYNYATYPHFAAYAWTASSVADYKRTFLKVDLSNIPANAIVESATLYLYSDPTVTSSTAWNGNSQYSGSNAVYFEKVSNNWSETSITWNNQPATTSTGRIWFPPSTSTTENIQVDISSFVQPWVNNPATNYGLRMKLENESYYRSRTYASENHSNTSIRPKLVITYSMPTGDPVADELNFIFNRLDKSQVPTSFLRDFGASFLPMDVFNGILSDSNKVNMNVWKMGYASLYTSKIYEQNSLPDLATVNASMANALNANSAIPVAMAYARYDYLRPDAEDLNLVRMENGQIVDVAGRTQSPYFTKNFFIASPGQNKFDNGSVTLLFKPELFYNTTSKAVQTISVDFRDGKGYQPVSWNTPVSATYSSTGTKWVKIRLKFTDNTFYECYSPVDVNATTGIEVMRYDRTPDFEESFPPVQGMHSGGWVSVAFGSGNTTGQFQKPLIVAEGIDPSDVSVILQNPNDYESFIRSINRSATVDFDFNDALDNAEYDLIFLDYGNGVDDIRRNAALLEEVINWVNENKTPDADQNVVMGISMGGLVARYALANMTKTHGTNSTQTRLLITHDSPHQGAVVPLGFQHLVSVLGNTAVVRGIRIFDIMPAVNAVYEYYESTGARQMLTYTSDNGIAVENTFLANIYRPMISFDEGNVEQPKPSYRMIATSQGAECGIPLFDPYAEIFRTSGEFYFSPMPWIRRSDYKLDLTVNALPSYGQSQRITSLDFRIEKRTFWFIKQTLSIVHFEANSPSDAHPLDGAPGGMQPFDYDAETLEESANYNESFGPFFRATSNATIIPNTTFVPTVSALDISYADEDALFTTYTNGFSPIYPSRFADFKTQERDNRDGENIINNFHTTFTDRNSEWMYNEMENVSNNNLNCSSECQPIGVKVNGSPTVCGSETYAIDTQLPEGSVTSWTNSSNLTYVSGQGTSNFTVQPSSSTASGTGWVEAVYNLGCGNSEPIRKEIWIGKPGAVTTNPSGSSTIQLAPGQTKTVYATSVPGASSSSLNWWISGGSGMGILSKGSNNVVVEAYSSGYYTLNVTSKNSCGESVTRKVPFEVSGGGGGDCGVYPNPPCEPYLTAYPNPNQGVFTIEIDEHLNASKGDKFRIMILDNSNNMIYEKYTAQRKVSINLQHTRKGWYYLLLQYKGGAVSKKIKIE